MHHSMWPLDVQLLFRPMAWSCSIEEFSRLSCRATRHGGLMKLSSIVRGILVGIAMTPLLAASGVMAAKTYNASHSNSATLPSSPGDCPKGQTMVAKTSTGQRSCVVPASINYNASKSNTGNVTATPDSSCPGTSDKPKPRKGQVATSWNLFTNTKRCSHPNNIIGNHKDTSDVH